MQNDKVLNLIGLAQKAGKVVSGEFMTEKAVKTGEAALVILAEDASEIRKRNSGTCVSFIRCPFASMLQKIILGMPWERNSEHHWQL